MTDTRVAVVHDTERDHYFAAVVLDGVPTSFSCTHLHHTPAAAVGCMKRTRTRWDTFAASTPEEVAPGIYELRFHTTTTRYRFTPEVTIEGAPNA